MEIPISTCLCNVCSVLLCGTINFTTDVSIFYNDVANKLTLLGTASECWFRYYWANSESCLNGQNGGLRLSGI